jgi:hypothetical protein
VGGGRRIAAAKGAGDASNGFRLYVATPVEVGANFANL